MSYYGTFLSARYDSVYPLGFYELHRIVSDMKDPTYTYLFTTDGCAPKPLDTGKFFLYSDYRLYHYLLDVPLPSVLSDPVEAKLGSLKAKEKESLGYRNNSWTWRTLLLSNIMSYYRNFDSGFNDTNMKQSHHLLELFNFENPYKRNTILFAVRKGCINIGKVAYGSSDAGDEAYTIYAAPW